MHATEIEGRLNGDGSIDLRFSTDVDLTEVSIAPDANQSLLAVALQTIPQDVILGHDGLRLARFQGQPVVQFRFGEGNWLSLVIDPLDLEVLRDAKA